MANYEVGYGKPPNHSKFKSGQSGNPKGRPKGKMSTAKLLEKHLDAKMTFNVGNKRKKMSRREALILSLIGDAFKGNHKAKKQLLDLALSLDAQFQVGKASAVDAGHDRAVLDALLYSYGMSTGLSSGGDTASVKQKPHSSQASSEDESK